MTKMMICSRSRSSVNDKGSLSSSQRMARSFLPSWSTLKRRMCDGVTAKKKIQRVTTTETTTCCSFLLDLAPKWILASFVHPVYRQIKRKLRSNLISQTDMMRRCYLKVKRICCLMPHTYWKTKLTLRSKFPTKDRRLRLELIWAKFTQVITSYWRRARANQFH